MNVGNLIEQLKTYDPSLEVQVFHDTGPLAITGSNLYEGLHEDPNNEKSIYTKKYGIFVGIGNPTDYECEPEFKLII